jgi:phage repressor protein C with HTH and peptisase S24 domain
VAEILGLEERVLKEQSFPIGRRYDLRTELVSLPRGECIPVYGQAVGGKDDEFVLSGNQVSEVLAPPTLLHVPNAYAVYVVGDSMEPRYFAGETVFVNPRLPISRGSFVVAQISKDQEAEKPRAYIKRFLSQDAKRLRLEQYNPKKIFEFSTSTVVAIHRIVMSGESR